MLTSHEAARLANVSPSTLLAWIDKGLLPAFRTPGGHRRIEKGALRRFLFEHGMPIPPALAGASQSLLIIDDQEAFLRSARRALAQLAPYLEVETTTDPVEGLVKVGTLQPTAVLIDALMPVMDGVAVCERLRASPMTQRTRVIAITGHPSAELTERFLSAGAVAVLEKPLNARQILSLVSTDAPPVMAEAGADMAR